MRAVGNRMGDEKPFLLYFPNMNHLALELVNLGLSEKEAVVYLALLELSPAAVQDVAAKAGVNRTTTYLLIDALMRRGIVSTTTHGKKQLFVAEPPERLLTVLRLQRRELEEKERELMAAIPLLNALHNSRKEKPQIRYFEGAEGVRTVRELLSEETGECVQIVPVDETNGTQMILDRRADHFAELGENGVPIRALIVTASPDADQVAFPPNARFRVISASEFPIRSEVTIRGNTVLLFSYKSNLLSVVIQSEEFAGTLRALFNLAWKGTADVPTRIA